MNNNIISNLKLIYKPLIMYYGEWELDNNIESISITKNNKNLYKEFLNRYYYMPLNVIFKDEELVKTFKFSICSRLGDSGRNIYFSKRTFLRTIISNVDEIIDSNGEEAYKDIKRAIRIKKDVYRDVEANMENSEYYEEVKNEYLSCESDLSLEEFINICKKKYTRMLNGYNAVLDLFDKPLPLDKFINCFEPDQLYLFTCYSLLQNSKKHFEKYGKVDYNLTCIDSYKTVVETERKKDNFYNSHITLKENDELRIYTIDDLFKEYDELITKSNK